MIVLYIIYHLGIRVGQLTKFLWDLSELEFHEVPAVIFPSDKQRFSHSIVLTRLTSALSLLLLLGGHHYCAWSRKRTCSASCSGNFKFQMYFSLYFLNIVPTQKVERRKRRKLPMIERPRSAPIYAGEQLPYSSHIRCSPIYSHPLHHLLNLH